MFKIIMISLFILISTNAFSESNSNLSDSDQSAEEIAAEILRSAHARYVKEQEQEEKQQVIMYSTQWCGYCRKARNYFKEKGILYTEYDIEGSRLAKIEYDQYKGRGVPLIVVGGKTMRGFSANKFDQLYSALK